MAEVHKLENGGFLIGHGRKDCACKPVKKLVPARRTSGTGGQHQGYKSEIVYIHHDLEKV